MAEYVSLSLSLSLHLPISLSWSGSLCVCVFVSLSVFFSVYFFLPLSLSRILGGDVRQDACNWRPQGKLSGLVYQKGNGGVSFLGRILGTHAVQPPVSHPPHGAPWGTPVPTARPAPTGPHHQAALGLCKAALLLGWARPNRDEK